MSQVTTALLAVYGLNSLILISLYPRHQKNGLYVVAQMKIELGWRGLYRWRRH